MPELPELEVLAENLGTKILGREIVRVSVRSPSALKTVLPPIRAFVGKKFTRIDRRGKHLIFQTDAGIFLVVHLMRSGRFQYSPADTSGWPKRRPGR